MPTNKQQLQTKIGKLQYYVKRTSFFSKKTMKELVNDENLQAALERFLYLTCDSMISILEMFIAYKSYRPASLYNENVDILLEEKEISEEQAHLLYNVIGLRNVLSHDYEKLDKKRLKYIVDEKLKDLEDFVTFFEKKL